ncbi:hypothetical protein PPACK8108_LOCUS23278 [Phakopsora pachyrhizi]|uniref:Uncharacterized protein n=1 Tax=Phakopsora pachyrhizi TaxID=170000 RepID=A0AAV0BP95_PHAPC|nr:hypothetical protein PPACK8108_LOCUS23278 [Phakopsora pachyrhizi]
MKPDSSLPAYGWNFSNVNPPVQAWAAFRFFKIEWKMYGREDFQFLERVFQNLLLNSTLWVNQKNASRQNVFDGGFLGHDNIGLFNQSEPLLTGGSLGQADGTAWMAFFALNILNIALETTSKDGFYYNAISWGNGNSQQLAVRSLVGLIPIYVTLTLELGVLKRFPEFKKRVDWFTENRPEFVTKNIIANMMGIGKQ